MPRVALDQISNERSQIVWGVAKLKATDSEAPEPISSGNKPTSSSKAVAEPEPVTAVGESAGVVSTRQTEPDEPDARARERGK
jgi:hypothetical protein